MPIELKTVKDKKSLREFIFLPETIHGSDSGWLPPIYSDEWKFYNPAHNIQLRHSDSILFLAYKNAKPVGRVMGIINRKYNAIHNTQSARFYNLESYDDFEVVSSLMEAVEAWARSNGMTEMYGPFGFSDKDPQGLRVEGFEHLAVLATATNASYLPALVERCGYTKKEDCVVYAFDIPARVPEVYENVSKRIASSGNLRLLEFTSKKQLKPWIIPVFRLVNETYAPIFGFMPMEEEEMKSLADQYLPLLNPAFTKLVLNRESEPVAFIVSSPDISKGIIQAKGRIFPFGFIHILSSARKSTQLDLFLGAVRTDYQNRGLTAILGAALFRSAIERKMKTMDSHLILETNHKMRAVMERLGARVYKRYRIYGNVLM